MILLRTKAWETHREASGDGAIVARAKLLRAMFFFGSGRVSKPPTLMTPRPESLAVSYRIIFCLARQQVLRKPLSLQSRYYFHSLKFPSYHCSLKVRITLVESLNSNSFSRKLFQLAAMADEVRQRSEDAYLQLKISAD